MSNVAPTDLTRKIMVLTFHKGDYELLESMLAEAVLKIPDLNMDSMCSTILTEVCRQRRESAPSQPVLPS